MVLDLTNWNFFIMRSFPLTGSDPHRKSVILSLGAGRSRNFLHFFQVRIDLYPTQAKTSFFEPKRRSQHRLCPYFPLKPRSDAPMHQRLCCVPSSHPSLHSFISLSILRTSLSLLFPLSVNSAMDQHWSNQILFAIDFPFVLLSRINICGGDEDSSDPGSGPSSLRMSREQIPS